MAKRLSLLLIWQLLLLALSAQSAIAQSNQSPLIFADTSRDVVLVGTIRSFSFSSPESIIELEVESSSGQPSIWRVTTRPATELRRLGWTSQSLFAGELVQINGSLVPGSRLSVQLEKLIRANGQELVSERQNIFDRLLSGTYQAVTSQSSIQLSFDHYGFSRSIFYFNDFDAELQLDAENISASQFQFDLLTENIYSSSAELTRTLKSGAFFDSSNFPLISVSASSIQPIDDSRLRVIAQITIKGISQPADFEVHLNESGIHPDTGIQTIGFSGFAQLQRSDWGFIDYLPGISDEIHLQLHMQFELAEEQSQPQLQSSEFAPPQPANLLR